MKSSKLSPSGRILMKLWISEMAWSTGRSLYNGTQEVSSQECGGRVETSTNDSPSEPSSLHFSASGNDHVRSYRICWICGHVVRECSPTETREATQTNSQGW